MASSGDGTGQASTATAPPRRRWALAMGIGMVLLSLMPLVCALSFPRWWLWPYLFNGAVLGLGAVAYVGVLLSTKRWLEFVAVAGPTAALGAGLAAHGLGNGAAAVLIVFCAMIIALIIVGFVGSRSREFNLPLGRFAACVRIALIVLTATVISCGAALWGSDRDLTVGKAARAMFGIS